MEVAEHSNRSRGDELDVTSVAAGDERPSLQITFHWDGFNARMRVRKEVTQLRLLGLSAEHNRGAASDSAESCLLVNDLQLIHQDLSLIHI